VAEDELRRDLASKGAAAVGTAAPARRLPRGPGAAALLLAQFRSPLTLLLLFAATLSLFLRDAADASIILGIVAASALLGFWQERGAAGAVEKLLSLVEVRVKVVRDGAAVDVPADAVVPGDVIELSAGGMIPADCRVLEAKDLHVDEAALTGETFPADKAPGLLPAETPLARRTNYLFAGTHVVSGTGRALVTAAGDDTELGRISARLKLRPPETEFERGVRRFGYLLVEVTLLLVTVIFAVNVYLERPALESFLFSLALAVGLTPQLLPAVISVNLSHGARRMAKKGVIVKRLASIENFGSMEVLCSDKTGTLTQGVVRLAGARDVRGGESPAALLHGHLNAVHESGFANPLDEALRRVAGLDTAGYEKRDEVPYDFVRKRLSVLLARGQERVLVTKGAVARVLEVCSRAEAGVETLDLAALRPALEEQYQAYSRQGYRTLAVASRRSGLGDAIAREDERDLTFLGFLLFEDPPKPGVAQVVSRLRAAGVSLRMVTGDNRHVAAHVAQQVGMARPRVVTGEELRRTSDEALRRLAPEVDVFAEVEPNQKERVLRAFQKGGRVVGYLGDGINDASALHAADVGISVDGAVDVARSAADLVLLEKDLAVLLDGVSEGRVTFANTLKYVFMATSANFGNMFSMAGASLFLPFLPLLPKQVLLTNLLTDLPEMAIASDGVDPEAVERPRRWDIGFIRRFMVTFGLLSSVFDYLTFGVLLWGLGAGVEVFRAGWFVESVVSACLIVLVVRTRRPFWKRRPGRVLFAATLAVVAGAVALPYALPGAVTGFEPLPGRFLGALLGIVVLYVAAAEGAKRWLFPQRSP
jgi:Mg2+-importing ATPase